MKFLSVVALDSFGGLAKSGKIPWDVPADRAFFAELTRSRVDKPSAIICGRKTWDSFPAEHRPLKRRTNIVLSRNESFRQELNRKYFCHSPDGNIVKAANGIEQALRLCEAHEIEQVFVVGGAEIYREAFKHPEFAGAIVSAIPGDFKCDVFLTEFSVRQNWHKTRIRGGEGFTAFLYLPQ